jgi:two-component system, NtrC family, response regulator AtoC
VDIAGPPARGERIEVLLVGGPELAGWIAAGLEGIPHRVVRLPSFPETVGGAPDLALVDESPAADFHARLSAFKRTHPRCQVLLVGAETSTLNPRSLGSAVVRHWFFRPVVTEVVVETLRAAGRSLARDRREQERHTRSLASLDDFVGTHPALRETLDLARRVATSPSTSVLVLGETGTGKGLLARAIHGESSRSAGPFVEINCAAIPSNLLESELFGHTRGAFTSAVRDKPGLLELADGGTAFLDEIGELEPVVQAKILKFLDEGVLRRLAATSTVRVNVRMIAATNRELEDEVREGRFRLDLFHRLNVMVLRLPPLRERREDIPLLARRFLAEQSRGLRGEPMTWSDEALEALTAYDWPGNVRELMNLTERLALLAPPGAPVAIGQLPAGMLVRTPLLRVRGAGAAPEVALPPEGVPFDDIERAVLEAALRMAEGNVTQAAALLGMGRGSLRYRLDRLELEGRAARRRGRPMGRRRPHAA